MTSRKTPKKKVPAKKKSPGKPKKNVVIVNESEPATLPPAKLPDVNTIANRVSEIQAALASGQTTSYSDRAHVHFPESTIALISRALADIKNEVD